MWFYIAKSPLDLCCMWVLPDVPKSVRSMKVKWSEPSRVYLMPREALKTLFLHSILKIASVGKGLVLSCSQGKGGIDVEAREGKWKEAGLRETG